MGDWRLLKLQFERTQRYHAWDSMNGFKESYHGCSGLSLTHFDLFSKGVTRNHSMNSEILWNITRPEILSGWGFRIQDWLYSVTTFKLCWSLSIIPFYTKKKGGKMSLRLCFKNGFFTWIHTFFYIQDRQKQSMVWGPLSENWFIEAFIICCWIQSTSTLCQLPIPVFPRNLAMASNGQTMNSTSLGQWPTVLTPGDPVQKGCEVRKWGYKELDSFQNLVLVCENFKGKEGRCKKN